MSNEVYGAGAKWLHAKPEWCQVNRTRPLVPEKMPRTNKNIVQTRYGQPDRHTHYEAKIRF